MRDLMHLGKYTAEQTYRGYSSATKSMAIAKSFANLWKHKVDVRTYCYAVFCKGGYSLPSEVYDVELEKSNLTDEEIKPSQSIRGKQAEGGARILQFC